MTLPFITIIIPCRNEEVYISGCLDTILANNYPKDKIEIFIVDGISNDNTLNIVGDYLNEYPFIKILQNYKTIFPAAVNIGINASHGEFIFIMGAHAHYDERYISSCIENSVAYDADNVGGVLITCAQNNTFFGNVITTVLSSKFGVGNSTFRTGSNKTLEVDTVFGGCYKRNVFGQIGLFNENLISTSDFEFNKRLRRSGGKIILVPDIKVTYYTRTTFNLFLRNNFRNGFWSVYPIAIIDYFPISLRHLVPLFFLMSLLASSVLSFFGHFFGVCFFSILTLYFVIAIYFSVKTLKFKMFMFLPFFYFLLHMSYGLGSFSALVKILILKISSK